MIDYDPSIEQFNDCVDFGPNDPCIWIVYPAGAAGDLLASIVNFHYVNTGANYYGINDHGQTIFRPTDRKLINNLKKSNELNFNDDFFYKISSSLGERNLNYSLLDQVLFSNHCWEDSNVQKILQHFPQAKIIRILPKTYGEKDIIDWLSAYKNLQTKLPVPTNNTTTLQQSQLTDLRLLDIYFLDLFQESKFEIVYQKIINLLTLPGPMIRYDFVKFWLNKQPAYIREILQSQ